MTNEVRIMDEVIKLREAIAAEIRVHGKSLGLWTERELEHERARPSTIMQLETADRILEALDRIKDQSHGATR